ncbi:hypothetical protein Y1Q_0010986 [Alligator mississippiensis]|uniref:Uncharacterized protein n=1 Tax=Alligator mississippiensis TaxID=8496 RepID=A0A151NLB9_ALLMI|nr:hypothetical protein Y1Q_0010986 [Alligator mississippiensis]
MLGNRLSVLTSSLKKERWHSPLMEAAVGLIVRIQDWAFQETQNHRVIKSTRYYLWRTAQLVILVWKQNLGGASIRQERQSPLPRRTEEAVCLSPLQILGFSEGAGQLLRDVYDPEGEGDAGDSSSSSSSDSDSEEGNKKKKKEDKE